MQREEAIAIAQAAAKANPPSYYSDPFEPHAWVVDAVLAAGESAMIVAIDPESVEYEEAESNAKDAIENFGYAFSASSLVQWIRVVASAYRDDGMDRGDIVAILRGVAGEIAHGKAG
jgi:hypothetical protein